MQYTFRKDGAAWMNGPAFRHQKSRKSSSSKKQSSRRHTSPPGIQDTSAARATLTAQLNALMGQ